MIARIWRGATRAEDAEGYVGYLEGTGLREYRETPGNLGAWVLWRRVGERAEFVLANGLQMPLPPKARRRQTDKIDTARIQREFLAGQLPLAHQPPLWWRQVRRLVALRESLVGRRTAVRNWINRYLAHETWVDRDGLWTQKGLRRLRALPLPEPDRQLLDWRVRELLQVREPMS